MFGFGKKLTITDDELTRVTSEAIMAADAIRNHDPRLGMSSEQVDEFGLDNGLDPIQLSLLLEAQGIIDYLKTLHKVSRKTAINSNPQLAEMERIYVSLIASMGSRSLKTFPFVVRYCSAFVAGAEAVRGTRRSKLLLAK